MPFWGSRDSEQKSLFWESPVGKIRKIVVLGVPKKRCVAVRGSLEASKKKPFRDVSRGLLGEQKKKRTQK